jgi:hypothetical protein
MQWSIQSSKTSGNPSGGIRGCLARTVLFRSPASDLSNLFPQISLSQQDYLIIKFLKKAAALFNGFPQALEGVW